MKAKVLSLSRARKARDKAKKRVKADENAVKFGRTRADKKNTAKEAAKAARLLDGHKRDET